MAGSFVKYNSRTREIFSTKIYSPRWMKLLRQPLSHRPDATVPRRSHDEVHEVPVAQLSNVFTRESTRCSRVETDDNQNDIVEAFSVFCLPAVEFSLPLLVFSRPVSLHESPVPEVEVEEPEVDELFVKRALSSGTACPVAFVSQSISNTDLLSIIREFVERLRVKIQCAEKEEGIRGYLRSNLENARQK